MAGNASAQIYADIKRDIVNNELKAQQRISEEELAGKYSVSRTPVREAIRRLEADGFVTCIVNVGTFVKQVSAKEISDFFDVRGVLEGLTARIAAAGRTPGLADELSELDSLVLKAHKAKSPADANRYDAALHSLISKSAGNTFAVKYLDSLSDRLLWFLNISNLNRIDYYGGIPMDSMTANHKNIIEAIRSGDPALAERHARAHVEEAKRYFIDYCYNKFML